MVGSLGKYQFLFLLISFGLNDYFLSFLSNYRGVTRRPVSRFGISWGSGGGTTQIFAFQEERGTPDIALTFYRHFFDDRGLILDSQTS